MRLVLTLDPEAHGDILEAIRAVPKGYRAQWAIQALRGGIRKADAREAIDDAALDNLGFEL